MIGGEQIRVDGDWVATIGRGAGELRYSTVADGGCEQASWEMSLPATFLHPSLVAGKLAEIRIGPENIWAGVLDEPNRQSAGNWTFSAAGGQADLADALCLDSGGNASSKPDEVIDRAIADGAFRGTRPSSLSSAAFTTLDATVAPGRIGELVDAWADSVTKRWGVNEYMQAYAASDPTTPDYYIAAGAGTVGLVPDEYASDLYGRYMTGVGAFATVHVSDAVASASYRREEPVDLTPIGIIDVTKATNILTGKLAKAKARFAWTEAITVSQLQITTPGGQPVFLPFVKAGTMARLFGQIDEQGNPLPYIDFVIGRTEHVAGSREITISPVNLAARSLGDVLALATNS